MTDNPTERQALAIPPVRNVAPTAVFRWLRLGWHDLRNVPIPSLFHGLIVILISFVVLAATRLQWQLVMIAASCFLLIGPLLATGLYALSKSLLEHRQADMSVAVDAWRHSSKCLFRFGLLLLFASAWWAGISLLLYYLFVDVSITEPLDFLRYVLTQHDALFSLWLLSGGLFAALAFGVTVISMPLLVDRDVSTWLAVRTSIRAVGENPFTMVWWAVAILVLTGVSFATGLLGFLVLYPLLGHASWHVYRDLVDPSTLPTYPAVE